LDGKSKGDFMKICSICRSQVSEGNRFCNICGNKVESSESYHLVRSSINDYNIKRTFDIFDDRIDRLEKRIDRLIDTLTKDQTNEFISKEHRVKPQKEVETGETKTYEYKKSDAVVSGKHQVSDIETESLTSDDLDYDLHMEEEVKEVEKYEEVKTKEVEEVKTTKKEVEPPNLPIPQLFDFNIGVNLEFDSIKIPTSSSLSTKREEKSTKQYITEIFEGPVLIASVVLLFVLALIFLAFTTFEEHPTLAGYSVISLGVLLLLFGQALYTKYFESVGMSNTSILFIIVGYILSMAGIMTSSIADDVMGLSYLVLTGILITLICLYFGYINNSAFLLNSVSLIGLITPFLLVQFIETPLLSFGGGLIWILPIAIVTFFVGLHEKTFLPAIILLSLAPVVTIAVSLNITDVSFPSLTIVASIVPVTILLNRAKIELERIYLVLVYSTLFIWPVLSLIIIDLIITELSVFDPIIILLVAGVSFIFATSHFSVGGFKPSEMVTSYSLSMNSLAKYIMPIWGILLGYLAQKKINTSALTTPDMAGYYLDVLIPIFLLIISTSIYFLLSLIKRFGPSNILQIILAMILVESIILQTYFSLTNIHLIENFFIETHISLLLIVSGPLLISIFFHYLQNYFGKLDNIVIYGSAVTLFNTFWLITNFGTATISAISIISGFSVFFLSLFLTNISSTYRRRLYELALIGNFLILAVGQLNERFNTLTGVFLGFEFQNTFDIIQIAPFIVFALYVIIASFSFYKITSENYIDSSQIMVQKNFIGRIEYLLLRNQELSFLLLINVLYLIMLQTGGFDNFDHIQTSWFILIVMAGLTLTNCLSIYLARGRSWVSVIIVNITYLASAARFPSEGASYLVFIFIPVVLLTSYLAYNDRIKERGNFYIRGFGRDFANWLTFLGILYFAPTINALALFLGGLLFSLSSLILSQQYREHLYSFVLIIFLIPFVGWMPITITGEFGLDLTSVLSLIILTFTFILSVYYFNIKFDDLKFVYPEFITNFKYKEQLNVLKILFALIMNAAIIARFIDVSYYYIWLVVISLLLILVIETTKNQKDLAVQASPFILMLNITFIPFSSDFLAQIFILLSYVILSLYLVIRTQNQLLMKHGYLLMGLNIAFFSLPLYPQYIDNLLFRGIVLVSIVGILILFIALSTEKLYSSLPLNFFIVLSILYKFISGTDIYWVSPDNSLLHVILIFYLVPTGILLAQALMKQGFNYSQPFAMANLSLLMIFEPLNKFFDLETEVMVFLILVAIIIVHELTQPSLIVRTSSGIFAIIASYSISSGINGGLLILSLIFISQLLYQVINLYMQKTEVNNYYKGSKYLIIPILTSIFILNVTGDFISSIVIMLSCGLLIAFNELGDSERQGFAPLLFIFSLFINWMRLPKASFELSFFDETAILVAPLTAIKLILPLGLLVLTNFKTNSEKNNLLIFLYLIIAIVLHSFVNDVLNMIFLSLSLISFSVIFWADKSKTSFLVMSGGLLFLSPILLYGNLKFPLVWISLLIFAFNILYLLYLGFDNSKTFVQIKPVILGTSLLLLGRIIGNDTRIWGRFSEYSDNLINLWVILMSLWLISLLAKILTSGFKLSLRDSTDQKPNQVTFEGIFNLRGEVDAISISMLVIGLMTWLWQPLFSVSMYALLFIAAVGMVLVTSFVKSTKFDDTSSLFLSIFSFIILIFFSIRLVDQIEDTFNSIDLFFSEYSTLIFVFVILPLFSLAYLIINFRSIEHLSKSTMLSSDLTIIMLIVFPIGLILTSLDLILEFSIPVIIYSITFSIYGIKINDKFISVFSSGVTLLFGFTYGYRLNSFILDTFGMTPTIQLEYMMLFILGFCYYIVVWYFELHEENKDSVEWIIFIGIFAMGIGGLMMYGFSPGLGQVFTFITLGLVSNLTYFYGIKFRKNLFRYIGLGIIYGALVFGLPFLITIVRAGIVDTLYAFFTLFAGVVSIIMIFVIKKASELEDDSSLVKFFVPYEIKPLKSEELDYLDNNLD
jgi:hypothetical protein